MARYISLRVKLVLVVTLLIAVMAGSLVLVFPQRMDALARAWAQERARGMAVVLASSVAPGLEFDTGKQLDEVLAEVAKAPGVAYLAVMRSDGTLLAGWNWSAGAAPRADQPASNEVALEFAGDVLHSRTVVRARGGVTGVLLMGLALADLEEQRTHNFASVAVTSLVLLLIGLATSLVIGTLLVRPIQRLTTITSNIVLQGDLTQEIDIHSNDEVGLLADSFRQMVQKLRALPSTLEDMVDGVAAVTAQLSKTAHTVASGTTIVRARVRDTSKLVAEMLASLRGAAQNVQQLHADAERSAAANQEMVTLTQEVARSVQATVKAVESSNRAIEQMTASIQEIARNIGLLEQSLEETSSAATEMATSVEHVESNVKETAALSEQVSRDSATGERALAATLEGIDRIRSSSQSVAAVIEGLGTRVAQVGNILDVISMVADQTNLLALNAAIIAAQAGEHGRGFSVVAGEIKALAERTGASTAEIDDLIRKIQQESANALDAMGEGMLSVENGVRLGGQASEALRKIFESAGRSTTMVRNIADVTGEQALATKTVSSAVHRIVGTVQEINAASSAQARGCDEILRLTREMETMTQQVMRSSNEQSRGSEQIAQSVEGISDMVAHLNTVQQGQTRAAEEAMRAVETIQNVAEEQSASVQVLEEAIDALQGRAEQLRAAVRQFRI